MGPPAASYVPRVSSRNGEHSTSRHQPLPGTSWMRLHTEFNHTAPEAIAVGKPEVKRPEYSFRSQVVLRRTNRILIGAWRRLRATSVLTCRQRESERRASAKFTL